MNYFFLVKYFLLYYYRSLVKTPIFLKCACRAAALHWFDPCGQQWDAAMNCKRAFAVQYETGEATSCIMVLGCTAHRIPGALWIHDFFLTLPCVFFFLDWLLLTESFLTPFPPLPPPTPVFCRQRTRPWSVLTLSRTSFCVPEGQFPDKDNVDIIIHSFSLLIPICKWNTDTLNP